MKVDDARLRGRDEIRKSIARRPPEGSGGASFLDALDGAAEREARVGLGEALETIDRVDRKLREQPNFDNLDEYKKAVREFLERFVNRHYKVTRHTGKNGPRTKVYTMIERVDDALEDIERCLSESVDFDLAGRLDEIRGILVDLYT